MTDITCESESCQRTFAVTSDPADTARFCSRSCRADWEAVRRAAPLTQADLKSRLHYDPNTGAFHWLGKNGKAHYREVGEQAGWLDEVGYRHIRIFNKLYLAHRLAWLYVHGELPDQLDHRNNTPGDDRIDNLRPSTQQQNMWNTRRPITNRSGYKGVSWHRAKGKWRASITVDGKQRHLGYFATPEPAHQAYINVANELRGEFARAA